MLNPPHSGGFRPPPRSALPGVPRDPWTCFRRVRNRLWHPVTRAQRKLVLERAPRTSGKAPSPTGSTTNPPSEAARAASPLAGSAGTLWRSRTSSACRRKLATMCATFGADPGPHAVELVHNRPTRPRRETSCRWGHLQCNFDFSVAGTASPRQPNKRFLRRSRASWTSGGEPGAPSQLRA